jgi:preprotein translocase subunit SecB
MKLAPLQLVDYYITYLTLQANPRFLKEQPCAPPEESLQVIPNYYANTNAPAQQGASEWIVSLEILQSIPEGANLPYSFKLEIQGIVMAAPFLEGTKLQRAIHANGPAMLFGAAREIIRAATGRGPWAAVIIPSTNFLSDLPPVTALPTDSAPASTGVGSTKSRIGKTKQTARKATKAPSRKKS